MLKKQQKMNSYSCENVQENISAIADNEQQHIDDASIREHVTGCRGCAEFQQSLPLVHAKLCDELIDSQNLDSLWSDIVVRLEDFPDSEEISFEPVSNKSDSKRELWRWTAGMFMAASIATAIVVGSVLMISPQNQIVPLVAETTRDFETFQLRGGLLDVAKEDTNDIYQWMSAKVDFVLPEEVNPPKGFHVSGGRLCSFLNRRLAFFQFKNGDTLVSLYVMKSNGLTVPNDGSLQHTVSGSGLTTMTWAKDEFAFVAISELPAEKLEYLMARS